MMNDACACSLKLIGFCLAVNYWKEKDRENKWKKEILALPPFHVFDFTTPSSVYSKMMRAESTLQASKLKVKNTSGKNYAEQRTTMEMTVRKELVEKRSRGVIPFACKESIISLVSDCHSQLPLRE